MSELFKNPKRLSKVAPSAMPFPNVQLKINTPHEPVMMNGNIPLLKESFLPNRKWKKPKNTDQMVRRKKGKKQHKERK